MECSLVISIPLGEMVDVIFMYSACVVKIEGREFQANLIELPILEFDVILGMDWLSTNHATMDCYRKTIMFKLMGEIEFIFYGDQSHSPGNLISAMAARRLLRKGCQGYVAHVRDTSIEVSSLQEILVVKEYPDVFPEELPDLPPEREIEFDIDLKLGTNPISMAPY